MRPASTYNNQRLNELRNIYDEMDNADNEASESHPEDDDHSPAEIITSEDVKAAVPEDQRIEEPAETQNTVEEAAAEEEDEDEDDEDDIDIEKEMENLDVDDADLENMSDVELSDE